MPIKRRSFLKSAVTVAGCPTLAASLSLPLGWGVELASAQSPATPTPDPHVVGAGQDRLGAPHSMGVSSLAFKVLTADTGGNLFVIEHSHLVPGGPPLHLHLYQDECFYVMEGKVAFQVGGQRLALGPGESVLGPRRIPHTFSSVVPQSRLLIAFTPAGKMEQFFLDGAANPALALTPEFMSRYEMQWLGPSPFVRS
jgi:mannose-6-phosphate isomerase-like protein (cupin superfamily)